MSRATSIDELYIILVNKQKKFYHAYGSNDRSCVALRNEMSRLRINPLVTFEEKLLHFVTSIRGLSIVSFNCQSLHAHADDLSDRVMKSSNILMLSETFMDDNQPPVSVPNFDFIVRFQRNEKRNAGIAIYHNREDQYHIVSPPLEIKAPYSSNANGTAATSGRIADLCAIECTIANGGYPQKLF